MHMSGNGGASTSVTTHLRPFPVVLVLAGEVGLVESLHHVRDAPGRVCEHRLQRNAGSDETVMVQPVGTVCQQALHQLLVVGANAWSGEWGSGWNACNGEHASNIG